MAERVVKSTRWAVEEWGEVVAAAGSVAPTTWVREVALAAARGERGPAAPEYVAEPVAGGPPVPNVGRLVGVSPVGSAGSGGPVPPAGVAAPVVSSSPGAAGAPELAGGVALERAVADAMRVRFGHKQGLLLMARRAIAQGQIVVDGRVCRDPLELVDPASVA